MEYMDKKPKKVKRKPTAKQQRAIDNMVENGGNVSKAMRDAGYSAQTAKTPSKLTNSKVFKEFAPRISASLEKIIEKATGRMHNQLEDHDDIRISDLNNIAKDMGKLYQLFNGKPTENIAEVKPIIKIPKKK